MSDSFLYTLEIDDQTNDEFEIFFTVIEGYVSNDPFEPSEPDEFIIEDIEFNNNPVSINLFNRIVGEYEGEIISNIKRHLMEGAY